MFLQEDPRPLTGTLACPQTGQKASVGCVPFKHRRKIRPEAVCEMCICDMFQAVASLEEATKNAGRRVAGRSSFYKLKAVKWLVLVPASGLAFRSSFVIGAD